MMTKTAGVGQVQTSMPVEQRELRRILLVDDASELLATIDRLDGDGKAVQLLLTSYFCIGFRNDYNDSLKSLLRQPVTAVDVAFCSLAIRCLRLLLDKKLLDVENCIDSPVHALLRKLSICNSDSLETQAAKFLHDLHDSHPAFVSEMFSREIDGLNALEAAAHLHCFRVAKSVLNSSKYSSNPTACGVVMLQEIDLSDYAVPYGPRLAKSPLLFLSDASGSPSLLTEAARELWDCDIVQMWTDRLLGKFRWFFVVKAIVSTITRILILVFCIPFVYESLNKHTNSCQTISTFNQISEGAAQPYGLLTPMSLTLLQLSEVIALAAFAVFVNLLISKGESSIMRIRRLVLNPLLMLSCACVVFILLLFYASMQMPTLTNWSEWSTSNAGSVIEQADYYSCCLLLAFIGLYLFDWSLINDLFLTIWKVIGVVYYFITVVLFLTFLFSWVHGNQIPCESSFHLPTGDSVLNLWLGFFRAIITASFDSASFERLGGLFLVTYVFLVMFCFNFLISLISDRLSAVVRDIRYHRWGKRVYIAAGLSAFFGVVLKLCCRRKQTMIDRREKMILHRVVQ